MAFRNIAEWTTEQVIDWLKGLDKVLIQYISLFLLKNVKGQHLLNLRCDDLESLGICVIGHQELLLEAVEQLRNFHYEVSRENVQQLAVRVSCAANSLRSEVKSGDATRDLPTQALANVAHLMSTVKPLVCWLDRTPFTEQPEYCERKSRLLKLSLEASTYAQRGRFAERLTDNIAALASHLAALADYIIQDIPDPMLLQPSSVDTVCIKKKDNHLGFDIVPSFSGHYQVANIKFVSQAHASGKIEEGDEIIQVNYQTVIGWSSESVQQACLNCCVPKDLNQNSKFQNLTPNDLLLTLRRKPAARNVLSTPHLRPFRPIRRPWLGTLHNDHLNRRFLENRDIALRTNNGYQTADSNSDDSSSESSDLLSPSPSPLNPQNRLYQPKPRSLLQRRNTISCGSPISKRPIISSIEIWQELKNNKNVNHTGSAFICIDKIYGLSGNMYRRDISVSSTGLELAPRPKTYLGVAPTEKTLVPELKPITRSKDLITKHNKGKLDKSHSTPAYDFNSNTNDEQRSIVSQAIPESPSSDSPSIVIHSAEKVDEIIGFQKSSTEIDKALQFQKSKVESETKFNFPEVPEGKVTKLVETINTGMMKSQKKDFDKKIITSKQQIIKTTDVSMKNSSMNEGFQTIRDEIVEAINEQRLVTSIKHNISIDEPPVPPPRPACTQRASYKSAAPAKDHRIIQDYPPLKSIATPVKNIEYPPLLKPCKKLDASQISSPIKTIHHINPTLTHRLQTPNIQINDDRSPTLSRIKDSAGKINKSNSDISKCSESKLTPHKSPSLVIRSSTRNDLSMSSPGNSVVRMIPSGKPKSLKKKNSILAKRRKVSVKELSHSDLQGFLYQRCRTKSSFIWDLKWYVLVGNTLYGFKSKDASKSDCLIFLNNFTVSQAKEINSKPFAFKVYHTGTAFYFAAENQQDLHHWIDYIEKAITLKYDSWDRAHKKEKKVDESKHFSETDYSDNDFHSDKESDYKKSDLNKDKSSKEMKKIGSMSLDRKDWIKVLFSSRSSSKHKERKNSDGIKTTEKTRTYKRDPLPQKPSNFTSYQTLTDTSNMNDLVESVKDESNTPPRDNTIGKHMENKIPKHINYIHASNPNLIDFEKNEWKAKPTITNLTKSKKQHSDNFFGTVTLEEFMLKKQEEERQEVYSNRVLLGIERNKLEDHAINKDAEKDLQEQLKNIIPDIIYGELPNFDPYVSKEIQSRSLPKTPPPLKEKPKNIVKIGESSSDSKPVSIKGKDGYEKIVYTSKIDEALVVSNQKNQDDIPPEVLPRKPVKRSLDNRKDSNSKDFGYEYIYGDDDSHKRSDSIYSDLSERNIEAKVSSKGSWFPNKTIDDVKPLPPPKIMPKSKQVLHRQNSLTNNYSSRNSGPDMNPVFFQAESPEKFWLNSLRKNDRANHNNQSDEKIFAKQTEPSITVKSSEATIVKSDKLNKTYQNASPKNDTPLKSAHQYKPISLSTGIYLKTSPQFEMALDSKEPMVSKLRQIFQGSNTSTVRNIPGSIIESNSSKMSQPNKIQISASNDFTYTKVTPTEEKREIGENTSDFMKEITPDYSHLEYPPTFEPEIYSLAVPTTSLNLLRRKSKRCRDDKNNSFEH